MTADNITTPHMFSTRIGGVSGGVFEGLNLAEHLGDASENLRENFRRVGEVFGVGPDDFAFTRQVHGNAVIRVYEGFRHRLFSPIEYEADGLITNVTDLPLIVFTADCIPVLLHDPVRGAIAAVHAGWRGTSADITGVAIRAMSEEFGTRPRDVNAAIGAGISQCCFETDSDVPDALLKTLGGCEVNKLVIPKNGKYYVDLKAINALLLKRSGVIEHNISILNECTACDNKRYWSHRRMGGKRGSQASIIMLT